MACTTMRTLETLNKTSKEKLQENRDHEIHFIKLTRSLNMCLNLTMKNEKNHQRWS